MQVNHFSKLDKVFGFLHTKNDQGSIKETMCNWFGPPYRIVEQSSPIPYRLRSKNNKVTCAVYANRMKPYVDPAVRPIGNPRVPPRVLASGTKPSGGKNKELIMRIFAVALPQSGYSCTEMGINK